MQDNPNLRSLPAKVQRLLGVAAQEHGVTVGEILSGRQFAKLVDARHSVAVSLSKRGHTQQQIGRWLGIHHTSVCYALGHRKAKRIEEKRQVPYPDFSGEWCI